MRLTVRVYPGWRRTHVGGRYGGAEPPVLVVRVPAPAIDGRANKDVVRVLAEAFGVRPNAVTVVVGVGSRTKIIEVTGADPANLDELLEEHNERT